jgi:hypothetical protein
MTYKDARDALLVEFRSFAQEKLVDNTFLDKIRPCSIWLK